MRAIVHQRISQRHGEVLPEDVRFAWEHYFMSAVRVPTEREVRIRFDLRGRELEMVGVQLGDGSWLVYHAMTPPSKKTKREMAKKKRRLF